MSHALSQLVAEFAGRWAKFSESGRDCGGATLSHRGLQLSHQESGARPLEPRREDWAATGPGRSVHTRGKFSGQPLDHIKIGHLARNDRQAGLGRGWP
jgi:hypothetical protein